MQTKYSELVSLDRSIVCLFIKPLQCLRVFDALVTWVKCLPPEPKKTQIKSGLTPLLHKVYGFANKGQKLDADRMKMVQFYLTS